MTELYTKMILVVKTKNTKRYSSIELKQDLDRFVSKNKTGYEVILGSCIPYYDFDNKYKSKEEQEDKLNHDFETASNAVNAVFNEIDYPDIKIYSFISCGHDPACESYKNSFHFRIRGAGYYKCGKQLPRVELSDQAPYKNKDKRQLLRLVGCSKEGNDRPLLRYINNKIYKIDELNNIKESLIDYCVSNIADEICVENTHSDDQLIDKIKKINDDEKKYISKLNPVIDDLKLDTINQLVKCLSIERASDFLSWLQVLRCLKNISNTYNLDLLDIAHEFSKLAIDKYNKDEIDKFWNKDDEYNGLKINYPSLCYWAKIDNTDDYYKIISNNQKEYNESILSIINKASEQAREYEFCDYRQFISKNIEKKDEHKIWKYLSDSLIHVIDGGSDKIFTVNSGINNSTVFKTPSSTPFLNTLNDISFTVDNIPKVMSNYFIKYYQRKSYSKIDFIPYLNSNPCEVDTFNLFQGFPIKQTSVDINMNKIQKILYHLEHVICNGDKIMYDYILKWHSHLFQKPAEKIGVAILLYSQKHGSGKNKWCDFIMTLLGNDLWYKTCKLDDLTTKFNYHMQGKLLIIGDEIANYAGYKASDQLKALITETNMAIEPKGKDPYCVKACERYIFTTNSDVPLRIDAQDRRYCTLSVSEQFAQDSTYFKNLSDEMSDLESQQEFFNYLTSVDIENWDFRAIPMNEYKEELINETKENTFDFIEQWIDAHPNEDKQLCKDLYEDYSDYCKTYNTKAVNLNKFGKILKRKDIDRARVMVNGRRLYYYVNIQKVDPDIKVNLDEPYDSDG